MEESQVIFRPLSADDPEQETTEIESLCVKCMKNGTTRLLLTKIPFFKEIVLMSFNCDNCGYQNNEIQPGGKIEEKCVKIVLTVRNQSDLNRQVVKSDHASIKIPSLDFEIPSRSQKGEITTVEGIISRCIEGLSDTASRLVTSDPESSLKIFKFIEQLTDLKSPVEPFDIVLEDVSGNTFVSNPYGPSVDPDVTVSYSVRNAEQNHQLGVFTREEIDEEVKQVGVLTGIDKDNFNYENMVGEVMQFPTTCSECGLPCETNMKMTNIPHFKEVVIMATNCTSCGHRSNEVKCGGGIEEKGVKISLNIENIQDLSRDILKSETCKLEVPELELEVGAAALGGRFTTVEGLLRAMKEQLVESSNMFSDSQDDKTKRRFKKFFKVLNQVLKCERKVTMVLDDPAGNSYVQKMSDNDSSLSIIQYERSFDQNEELGLNDMKTENYEDAS